MIGAMMMMMVSSARGARHYKEMVMASWRSQLGTIQSRVADLERSELVGGGGGEGRYEKIPWRKY